jgi:flagellar motor component MotA
MAGTIKYFSMRMNSIPQGKEMIIVLPSNIAALMCSTKKNVLFDVLLLISRTVTYAHWIF